MVTPLIETSESISKIRELIDHAADKALQAIITGKMVDTIKTRRLS